MLKSFLTSSFIITMISFCYLTKHIYYSLNPKISVSDIVHFKIILHQRHLFWNSESIKLTLNEPGREIGIKGEIKIEVIQN